jgi:alkanesulfonate monooxygenase SsuD/methylene tetrahydromethanopterin reductase-like flavin-dependent oxidoreductase (luciferase family)
MKFGLFGSAQAQRGGADLDSGAGFRDFIEYNVEAEALGYDSSFVVEHHFTGFGQVSASLNLLTWVAARTSTLRLGTAVLVLPWHNPVLLAEQAATIDLLSGGRLEFGVGRGYRANEFAGFCIPMDEAEERFEEGLAVILKAWTSNDRFSHRGKYWNFETSSWNRRHGRSRIRRSGWRRASPPRSARWRNAASSCCSTSSPRRR